jgi:hypothetical protein
MEHNTGNENENILHAGRAQSTWKTGTVLVVSRFEPKFQEPGLHALQLYACLCFSHFHSHIQLHTFLAEQENHGRKLNNQHYRSQNPERFEQKARVLNGTKHTQTY